MNISQIRSQVTSLNSLIDQYESTGSRDYLVDAQEKATALGRALEHPRETIAKLFYSVPIILVAIKVTHDMGIFTLLSQSTAAVPLTELAALKTADPLFIERMMRLLVASGFANESAQHEYSPMEITHEMTQKASIGLSEALLTDFLPCLPKMPEYLKSINYRNQPEKSSSPFQYAYDVEEDGFTWLGQHPDVSSRFDGLMEGHCQLHPYWYNWFPVREHILDTHPLTPNQTLLVDIGGRGGHGLIGFIMKFPDAVGRLVLEDLPAVIDEVRENPDLKASGIESIGFDFFDGVQPVKDARVYYIRNVLHNWPDEQVVTILENIKPAMKAGYSKVIIEEYILPDRNAHSLPCMVDLGVMVFCSGMERTRQQWRDLITSVGLRIQKFWIHYSDRMGIIEVELLSANQGKTDSI